MSIEDLIDKIKEYNPNEISKVKKAYELAVKAHAGQFRESGEPYIIHPLNVCMNLTEFYADGASLCAGLLHDVVEDTQYTLEDIKQEFGEEVAFLVDGVTKISNLHYNSKDEATNANIRRLINSLNQDVRIIIIKLCDRLHNIRTLQYKKPEKQIINAEETLKIFVPLAYFIGAFRLKCELEDRCLSYIDPESYESIKDYRDQALKDYENCVKKATKQVANILAKHNIKYSYRFRLLNIYHIYQKVNKGYKLNNIHDLANLKIIVQNEEECYLVLGLIHKLYTPMNNKFKDYIACPKTNMYKSLHTTVFGPDNHLLQVQIKTEKMDIINTIGLAGYWQQYRKKGKEKMQNELKVNYQFFNVLKDINDIVDNDSDYIEKVKQEIFTNNIYVYTLNGEIIELPKGATIIDFAYKIHSDIGSHLYKAFINGKQVPLSKRLNNKDRIFVLHKDSSHPKKTWLNNVATSNARRKIREYFNKSDN